MNRYYIKVINNEVHGYPVAAENLSYLVNGEVNESSVKEFDYVPIDENFPDLAANQICTQSGWSRKEDGTFSIDWEITTFSQEEMLDRLIRARRSVELANSDWTQLPDSPLSAAKKQEWAEYRQALRDLTSLYPNPLGYEDVIWPDRPE